ncbi:hypothetical protein E2C01_017382 [Portunus trituberculatus]|uniref:Uncharacterized protein n=1 Tax=Portunus trituberculatus TaxID=210409 RepID=A0A5B7DRH8_PORTR|nr:hypothetical protein [Portunus trituberculatus]
MSCLGLQKHTANSSGSSLKDSCFASLYHVQSEDKYPHSEIDMLQMLGHKALVIPEGQIPALNYHIVTALPRNLLIASLKKKNQVPEALLKQETKPKKKSSGCPYR